MRYPVLALILVLVVSGCGSTTDDAPRLDDVAPDTQDAVVAPDPSATSTTSSATASERLEEIAAEVDAWAGSSTLDEARAHAEAAANLVVGTGGLGYGDRDGNDEITGEVQNGLLPGPDGAPAGIVLDTIGEADCVNRDVLGGEWDDPVARWSLLAEAIDGWAPDNNTFPSLPSHPMRIVGWATLTQSGTFEEAIEYAGHADLHVGVSRDALSRC